MIEHQVQGRKGAGPGRSAVRSGWPEDVHSLWDKNEPKKEMKEHSLVPGNQHWQRSHWVLTCTLAPVGSPQGPGPGASG